MIENDVVAHLNGDTTLDTLLSVTASDTKIYPEVATQLQQKTRPFIVYGVEPIGKDFSDIIDEVRIEFKVIHDNYFAASTILERLKFLLSIKDEIRVGLSPPTSIPSSDYFIYSGIVSGGTEFQEPDTRRFVRVLWVNFTYKKKA